MNLEKSLIGSYVFGTQTEINKYVSEDKERHKFNMALAYWTEFSLIVISHFLPESIEYYVMTPLLADLGIRWSSGVINSVKYYVSKRKSGDSISLLDAYDPIPQKPGLIGRIRELRKKL